jgi:hypothetical protein
VAKYEDGETAKIGNLVAKKQGNEWLNSEMDAFRDIGG